MSANEQKLYGAIIGAMGGYVLSTLVPGWLFAIAVVLFLATLLVIAGFYY